MISSRIKIQEKERRPTADLVHESKHVPVSVSPGDMFDRDPEHILSKDAAEVVRKFWEALVRPVRGFGGKDQAKIHAGRL